MDRSCQYKHKEMFILLYPPAIVPAGADPAATTRDGTSAYVQALRYGLQDVADVLAAAGIARRNPMQTKPLRSTVSPRISSNVQAKPGPAETTV